MSLNLYTLNRQAEAIADEVRTADPDVLILQEYSPWWRGELSAALDQAYPHRIAVARQDAFGSAIYSRLPFVGQVRDDLPLGRHDLPQMRVEIDWDGRRMAVYNIHLLPPVSTSYITEGRLQLADLIDWLERETTPVVLAGDFNFTSATRYARDLRRAALVSAHDLAGFGPGATWPVNGATRYLPVPGIRLDHLLLSHELTCAAIATGRGAGSDHRPIIATIGWRAEP